MRDRRGKLESDPFDYTVTSSGSMRISRNGKVVLVLGRKAADKLRTRIDGAGADAVQHALARATGHYRHGDE